MTDRTSDIPRIIQEAGVVGAGGAGFPSHVKAASKAEVVIVNAAECEPLMHKDKVILKTSSDLMLEGLSMMMDSTSAQKGIIAIKNKHKDLINSLEKLLKGKPQFSLKRLGDYYPAGDEFSLVYEATGKLIPPGGIPIQIGVVVNNVETLYNVAKSKKGPVVEKFLTVAGAVKKPCTVLLPIGVTFSDAIELAGGTTIKNFVALDGGAMMGRVVTDMSEPITKTSGGLIVLPSDHPLIWRKSAPRKVYSRIGKSVCDQCCYCTELCPRYLLGYKIEPHRVMRSLSFSNPQKKVLSEWALLCCECSLCSLYSCPEQLDPKNICVAAKSDLQEKNIGWKNSTLNTGKTNVSHPMREFRKIPVKNLVKRLGLTEYLSDAPFNEKSVTIRKVKIPLKQHVGVPSQPVVSVGQKITKGQVIAEIPPDQLGSKIHSSIDGIVKSIDSAITIEG